MLVYNVSQVELDRALQAINENRYEGNVIYKREPERNGRGLRFTLRVADSKGPGHRRGFSFGARPARRLPSLCWHGHGYFFDALFSIAPEARIVVDVPRRRSIMADDPHYDRWFDWQAGSTFNPVYASDLCDCYEEGWD